MTRKPPSAHRSFRRSHALRLPGHDYTEDVPVHLVLCSREPDLTGPTVGEMLCASLEFYCRKFSFRLFGYCLMPDHLHVMLTPEHSGRAVDQWLQAYKSYTTNRYCAAGGKAPLWQRSAWDHVCRKDETAAQVMMYIINNPVRKGLVVDWRDWPWTKLHVEL